MASLTLAMTVRTGFVCFGAAVREEDSGTRRETRASGFVEWLEIASLVLVMTGFCIASQ